MYKHIIWDFDGTLFDTYPSMARSFEKTLKHFGYTESYEDILTLMKVSMGHLFNHYEEKYVLDETFKTFYKKIRYEEERSNVKPFKDIEEICKKLVEAGKKNYVYTHRGSTTLDFLELFKMTDYFTEIITVDNGFNRKPDPEAIMYLVNKYQMNKEETIMIGDRELDILSGKNAGIHACYYSNGEEIVLDSADYSIPVFDRLYSILF